MPRFPTIPCLAGCVEKYYNPPLYNRVPWLNGGQEAENFSPFIWAKISDGTSEITVGNNSYPGNPNKAAIKSIEIGFVDNPEGRLEIIDEEGGEFSVFLDGAVKCGESVGVGSKLYYKLGWVYTNCYGEKGPPSASPVMQAEILSVKSNVSQGIIKFLITFGSSSPVVEQFRFDKNFGQEIGGKDMHLEDAIRQLAAIPPQINVLFAEKDEKGEIKFVDSFDWETHGKKGPKAAWHGDSQNKYSTIAKWIEPYRVKDGKKGKGVALIHDPSNSSNLIILKDPSPDDDEKTSEISIGTFIVNGGRCSSVLEFNPTMDYVSAFGTLSSGGSTNPLDSKSSVAEEVKTPNIQAKNKNIGSQKTITVTQSSIYSDGKNATKETNKSQEQHLKASRLTGVNATAINAELRLVGLTDPKFYGVQIKDSNVSIVFILPNYISGGKAGESCGDFLKRTDCHPIFSNKAWKILGVNHAIQDASFVTTLKLVLPAPGLDISAGSTTGGDSSGTQVKGTC